MGVDLATYRARIGTFISRRNVCCGDEKHSPLNVTRRWRGKDVCKVSDRGCYQDNLKCFMARMSLCLERWSFTLDVHICTNVGSRSSEIYRAAGKLKVLLTLVVTSVMSIRQLLILSGDVEVNPGPKGQHGEDHLDLQCSHDHLYEIASFKSFNFKAVAKRLIGPQLTEFIIGKEGNSEQDKRDEVFEKWLEMKGPKATYRELVSIFEKLQDIEAAQAVRKLSTSYALSDRTGPDSDSTNTKIDSKEHIETSTAPSLITTCTSNQNEELGNSAVSSLTPKSIHSGLEDLVDWKSLAIQLGMSHAKIGEIDVNNRGQVAECRYHMIQFWLQSDISHSWQKLIGALKSSNHSALAEKIKCTYCPMFQAPPQSVPTNPVPAQVESHHEDKCQKALKNFYTTNSPVVPDWPPVPKFTFINLALVKDTTEQHHQKPKFYLETIRGSADDIIETKEAVDYNILFGAMENVKPGTRILLEGRPGCGKTTLVKKLSRDWSEGKILGTVKYLFLVSLRKFYSRPIQDLSNILDTFHMQRLASDIISNFGEDICFIFDGLDEYSASFTKSGCSWFEQLLRGEELQSSLIFITSRPNASIDLRKSVTIRAEVLGFLEQHVMEYIDRSYADDITKAGEVKAYLKEHQSIRHMCYLPLHLVMVIFLYDNHKASTPLPKTETEVYTQFTIMTLRRYYDKKGIDQNIGELWWVPEPEAAVFKKICKLAYNKTAASRTDVSQHDMVGDTAISTEMDTLGLMIVDKKEGIRSSEPSYSFPHLTNQEFLAAYYMSTLGSEEQLAAVKEHSVSPHMGVVLKFYCGLTKLENVEQWEAVLDNALLVGYINRKVNLNALHCIFESQNSDRCKELFRKAEGKLAIRNETLTLTDYCAIGHCLAIASDIVTTITLECQLATEGLDIITQKLMSVTLDKVTKLDIRDDLHDADKLLALKRIIMKLPFIEDLSLAGCFRERGCSDWSLLGDILKEIPHLQTLLLANNNIGDEGIKALSTAACHWTNLQILYLSYNNIGYEGIKALSTAACHWTILQKLDLYSNNIGDEGIKALSTAACHWTNLQELILWNSNLGDGSIDSLVQIISHCPLKALRLSNIGTEWANHFTADSKDTLRAAAMSLQKDIVLSLPEEDSDVRGVVSPPAVQSDDEDEDYSWVQQLDDFLSTEGTNAPQQSSSPPPPSSD